MKKVERYKKIERVVKFLLVCAVMVFLTTLLLIAKGEGGYLWIVDAPEGARVRNAVQGGDKVDVFRKGRVFLVTYEDNYKIGTPLEDGTMGYIYKELCHIAHAEEIEAWEKKQREHIDLTYDDCVFVGEILEDATVYRQPNEKPFETLKKGETVYIRALISKYWYRVVVNNKTIGYVQGGKVRLTDLNIPGEGYVAIVRDKDDATEGTFVVREEPNTSSKKVTTLKENTYIKVIDNSREDGWYLVAYNVQGDMGYINKKWLTKVTSIFN